VAILARMDGVPTQLGHIALRVRDLDRAVAFYQDVVGLNLRAKHEKVAFLGIREDASHEVALFALPEDAPGPEQNRVGLYHMAWEMASFEDLERFHKRLMASDARITGYSDRQYNVMFLDPDGNELEALWEPTPEQEAQLAASGAKPKLQP
jgi:catechol-2,3-dioxygenase